MKTDNLIDEEKEALAAFGIRRFNSEKFENSDEDSVFVRSPVSSKGIDNVMLAFHSGIDVKDMLPQSRENDDFG